MNNKIKILLLEDDITDAELEERELRKIELAFTAKRVDTREAFLKALDEFQPNLILSDNSLPAFDGLTALTIVREKYPEIPFIFVSGTIGEERAIESLRNGATDYVLKTNLRKLGPAVRRALNEVKERIEHKQSEQALKKSEETLRVVFDNASDGILLADAATRKFHTGNKTICRMLGYTSEEIKGLDVTHIHPEKDLPYVTAQFEKQLRGEIRVASDIPVKRKDGSVFYADINSSPLTLVGKTYLLGIFRDITERKKAEQEMQKLSNVVQQTADIVIITDKDGLIQYANPAFEKLTGHNKDEAIGKTPRILKSDKQDNKFYENLWRTIVSGNTFRSELVNRKKSGELYYEEKTITPVKNHQGAITHFVSLGRDITERKRADAALNASETRYRRLFEAAKDGILILDAETGQIVDVNRFLIDLLGFSHQQFLGKKIWDVGFLKDIVPNKENFEELRRKKYIRYEDMPLETADGRRIDVEFVSNVYIEDNLKVVQCNVRNITERKKLEQQLRQNQKMEAIGQLVGGVAHDFNNALTVIDGYSTMMLGDLKPDDQFWEGATAIKKAADHAAGLTRQLLAFSRKQVLQKKPLNINALAANMEKMLTRVIGEHIRINLVLSPELKNANADAGQVEQVIMNLAVNARDAMPKGGALTIKTENVTIDQEYCRINPDAKPGGFIRLSIQDTGIGMAEDTKKRIFEPFFTTKPFGKGTGLGLSVVYGIVKQHDGWINAYSEPGKGAIFNIYLPCLNVEAQANGKKESLAPDALTGTGERILIVEDQAEILELLSGILRKNNYQVSVAATAKEAANIFDREKGLFHLVLADVVLPDKSGVDVVTELTAINPKLKVIFHSGYVDEQSQWSAIKEKGYPFLQKPYGTTELLTTIKQALAGQGIK